MIAGARTVLGLRVSSDAAADMVTIAYIGKIFNENGNVKGRMIVAMSLRVSTGVSAAAGLVAYFGTS